MASAGTAYVDVEAKLDDFASQIESAVSGVDVQTISVDADTSEAESAIASVEADQLSLFVEADTSAAQAEVDTVEGSDVEVQVTANTEQAQASVDQLADSTSKLTEAADGAIGGMSGLGGVAGGAASKLGAVGVAGGAAAVGVFGLVSAGLEAESAMERFNLVAGQNADAVRSIDVGGLSGDIGELALQLGSSDEAMLNATASFVAFAESTGAGSADITEAADNINALALRAVALNPALGDAGDVSTRLAAALARGGRALTNFQIGLTSSEINARALADTGKTSVDQLTQFEKSAAGAAIATERLGSSLGSDFAAGAENSATQAQAALESISELGEQIGSAAVPAVVALADATGPTIAGLSSLAAATDSLFAPVAVLSSAADDLGVSFGVLASGPVGVLIDAFSSSTDTGTALGGAFDEVAVGADDAAGAVTALSQSVDDYLDSTFALPQAQRELRDSFDSLFQTLLTEGHSADDVATGLEAIAYATGDLGAASGDMNVAADLSIQRLRAWRDQGIITEEQFHNIRDAIRGAQGESPLTVQTSAPGATQATGEVKAMDEAIRKVPPGISPDVQVIVERVAFDRLIRDLDAADNRRFAMQVSVNTVGSPMGRPDSAGAGGGADESFRGGAVYNINVNAPGANGQSIAQQISDELRKLERAGR